MAPPVIPLPTDDPPETWPELVIVAATIFGEARGEKLEAKIGVGLVIRNRVQSPITWWGDSWHKVCLANRQFAAWDDHNRSAMLHPLEGEHPRVWLDCLVAARMVIEPGIMYDLTRGAIYYHDITIAKPRSWGNDIVETRRIGRLVFYTEA